MKRLWSIIVVMALVVAPCVIVHASFGSANNSYSATVSGSVNVALSGHLSSKPANTQSGFASHDHDQDEDHNCQQNCNGWLSAGASNASSRITVLPPVSIPPVILAEAEQPKLLHPQDQRSTSQKPVPASDIPGTLSVLQRTARLRI